jgi:hypothetical protein
MRFIARLAVVISIPLSLARGQAAPGKNLAEDFRVTSTVQGMPDTMVIMGHVVGSSDKMRVDLTAMGPNAQVSPITAEGPISMIVTDSGRTISYLDSKRSQYVRVRPAEMLAEAQKMGTVKMDFSGAQASVDSLGAGPAILGHPTLRYRINTAMTISMTAFGQSQSVKLSSTTEYLFATDIKGVLNPFSSLSGNDQMNVFGASNKDFADRMRAAQAKLPGKTPLRASSSATVVAQGQTRVTNTNGEVTSVQWVSADPKVFEIPATYTAGSLPSMGGSNAPATTTPPPR